MPRVTKDIDPSLATVRFPNGTLLETRAGSGSATQFTPEGRGLRSTQLPSEMDTSPEFDAALQELGIREQETVHLDVLPPAGRLRSAMADDRIVLRPALPPGDKDPRVVLYQDESGGLSWHFAEGALLTNEERERAARRGLRLPVFTRDLFVISARTGEARETMINGLPRGSLRGPITKIGRKILKVLVIPVTDKVLGKPIEMIMRPVERKIRKNLVWSVTPDSYARAPDAGLTDWSRLNAQRTLLIVHGILSSVEGMLTALPRSAMERWYQSYGGRVIAFNHLSVTESPEDNARFFLEKAKHALPDGRFEFDVLCHSRGGIVSRMMAEHGEQLVPGSNAAFKSIYFVASPNNGSQLGDPDHIVDMIDVFTNILTNFPDGPVMYSIEILLAIVKLLASAGMKRLPGIEAMGTASESFIAQRLNATGRRLDLRYGAAASDYEPHPSADNAFLQGRFGNAVMGRIFEKDGKPAANDLVVPRDSVFGDNGHPMFPIGNVLLYRPNDAVWHSGFFSQARTCAHIDKHLQLAGDGAVVDTDQSIAAPTRRGGGSRGTLRERREAVPAAARPSQAIEVARHPSIDFHEQMTEGETFDLVVFFDELEQAAETISILLPAGRQAVLITAELSAPGFTIEGRRSAAMTVRRERDQAEERAVFRLTAKSPGPVPLVRKLIATFWQNNNCIGAVTHETTVVPKGYQGPYVGTGAHTADPLRFHAKPREDADLVIYVRALEEQAGTFDLSVRSRVPREEYDLKSMGELKLTGTEFGDFFRQVIDPQFATFPRDPKLGDEEFDRQLAAWNAKFLTRLADLGRKLWTHLPEKLRAEYLRLMALPTPPRALCVHSDEMTLPWEIIRPSGKIAGKFVEYQPLGIAHVLGRWRPGLGARPQPQSLPIKTFFVLNPRYGAGALHWADQESQQLMDLLGSFEKPSPVDRKEIDAILERTDVQMIHFNGHGTLGPNADLDGLELENNDSIAAMAFAARRLGEQANPVLFLNACSVGRAAQILGRPGGFAANCIEHGWSGVIAPYWPVYDPWAAECSLALYRKLRLGHSIGEALQEIRRDRPDDFTAQSYSYFGDPWARVLFP
jgi:CHAT domain